MKGRFSEQDLILALPKGRLLEDTADILKRAGVNCSILLQGLTDTRKLMFVDKESGLTFLVVRSADLPIYVQEGAANVGIVGKDVLDEGHFDVCEIQDLSFGRCEMVVAAPKGMADVLENVPPQGYRVATKYPNIAARYFGDKHIQTKIITLGGSVEVAPSIGIADIIVDLVATGSTLRDNGLFIVDKIMTSTARLVANKGSLTFKEKAVSKLVDTLSPYCKTSVRLRRQKEGASM